MNNFIQKLPKIELHAHLNGSLQVDSMKELAKIIFTSTQSNDFIGSINKLTSFNNLDECFKKFKYMHELTETKAGLMKATQMVIRDFAADNVVYLELRTTPKSNENMTIEEYLVSVLTAIETAKESKMKNIIVKLLVSIDRSRTKEQATETLQVVKKLRSGNDGHANLLVGLDLSGNPNCGSFGDFKHLLEEARQCGLKLALHCAEINNGDEIKEMIDFGMDRCGHGTFLSDAQIAQLYHKQTAIECCLTSNVKCKTVPSYKDHHFRRIFEHEQLNGQGSKHLVVCTDDSGVFDTTLRQELKIAVEHFDLNEKHLLQLQLNAIEHCFASDLEKEELRRKVFEFKATQNVE